jgi:hypothetical protein
VDGQNNSRFFEEKLIDFSHVLALSIRDLRYVKLRLLLIKKARPGSEMPSFKCNPKRRFDEFYRPSQSQDGVDIVIRQKHASVTHASACP